MALSQEDRIEISKKIIDIPKENENSADLQAQLEIEKIKAQKADNANKALMDESTPFIDGYQSELERYNGNGHTQLIEQDLIDSADRLLQNPFFPNDQNTPMPAIPDGAWKFFPPFSGNKGIGKNYNETYTPVTKEQDHFDDINTQIAIIEALVDATRSSGNECVDIPPEIVGPSVVMQQAAIDLKAAVQAWEDFLNGTDASVVTFDIDGARAAQNTASKADISNAIVVIDAWQLLQDFDTVTPVPGSCAAFDTFPAGSFQPSKFRSTELQDIKDEITARQAFITTRESELNTNLGTVTQDFNNGDITGGSGFYLKRFRFVDMRLNTVGGSLSKLRGIERGQDAQQQIQNSNDITEDALVDVMAASAFRAPATNINSVHVLNGSLFSPGDSAYVVANTQAEISVTIQSISNNRIVLDKAIPEKYRHTDGARLYKLL